MAKEHIPERLPLWFRLLIAVVPAAVGLLTAVLIAVYDPSAPSQDITLAAALSLAGLAIGIMLTQVAEGEWLELKLDPLEREFRFTLKIAHADARAIAEGLATSYSALRSRASATPSSSSEFLMWNQYADSVRERLEDMTTYIEKATRGELQIAPSERKTFERLILAARSRYLGTVSFVAENDVEGVKRWTMGPDGRDFLDKTAKLVNDKHVLVDKIFTFPSSKQEEVWPIVKEHAVTGKATVWILLSDVSSGYPESMWDDTVILDSVLLWKTEVRGGSVGKSIAFLEGKEAIEARKDFARGLAFCQPLRDVYPESKYAAAVPPKTIADRDALIHTLEA